MLRSRIRVVVMFVSAVAGATGCSANREERLDGECARDDDCHATLRCVVERCVDPQATFAVGAEVRGAPATIAVSASGGPGCRQQRCAVALGESASLVAPALSDFRFLGWSGHARCVSLQHTLQIGDVREDVTCTADYTARVRVNGVSADVPAPVAASAAGRFARCEGGTCEVDVGDTVTLLAASVPGSRLRGWSGTGCSEGGGALAIARDVVRAVTCTAHYEPGVSVSGSVLNADAEVLSESASPGARCERGRCAIDAGGVVTLRAPSLPGRSFQGWSGDEGCRGSEPTLVLRDVQSSKTCRASFAPRIRVNARVVPAEAGAVVASADGVRAACSGSGCEVDTGMSVSLTASAAQRYRFAGWSGGGDCVGTAHRLDLRAPSASLTCVANFATRPYAVTLVARDVAVEASVGDVPCPDNVCSVPPGGTVTFRAVTTGADQLFQGFACSPRAPRVTGPGSAVLEDVRADHTCVANVTERTVFTFHRADSSCGTVRPSVRPATGASTCTHDTCRVRPGATLVLEADPGPGCSFDRWTCGPDATPAIRGEVVELRASAGAPPVHCTAHFSPLVI